MNKMIERLVDLCFDTVPEWMLCSLCAEVKTGQMQRNEFQDADCVQCRLDQKRGQSELFNYLLTKSKVICKICKKSISCQRIAFHMKDCIILNKNINSYIDNFTIDQIIKCLECDQINQKPQLCKMNKCLICSDCKEQQNHQCEEKNQMNFTFRCKNLSCSQIVMFEECFYHFVNCEYRLRTCFCGFIGMKHQYKYHKYFCYGRARHLYRCIDQKRYQQHISFLGFKRLKNKEQKIKQKLQRQQFMSICLQN